MKQFGTRIERRRRIFSIFFEKNIDTKNDLRRPKKVNNVAAKLSLLL